MKNVKNKIKNAGSKIRVNLETHAENIKSESKSLIAVVIIAFILMILSALAVFVGFVQGAEKVMVPNVTGKSLVNALLEMQTKELYPKIQLKFSDTVGDQGTVLEQNPKAGSIVKAYRRVTLTVSNGVAVDNLPDFVGRNIDEVKTELDITFKGRERLIVLSDPAYMPSTEKEGTILVQYPEPETIIVDPIDVQFIISSGSNAKPKAAE